MRLLKMRVVILAAGYGTRLYPYTKSFPKPLLKIGKRPIINYLLDKIGKLEDVSSIIVVTNDRFFKQFKDWRDNISISCSIHIINDLTKTPEDRLGAIGDMHFAFNKEGLVDDFLVLGGDNLFKDSLVDFMHFAKSKHPFITIGLFDIKDKRQGRHYGVVGVNRQNRIVEFCEKPKEPKSSLVAMCLYYFPREKVRLIKEYLSDPLNSYDTAGTYINWLCTKDKVYGFIFKNFWFDIGHLHTYKKVGKLLGKGR